MNEDCGKSEHVFQKFSMFQKLLQFIEDKYLLRKDC